MHIVLYDNPEQRVNLYPLSLTRPVGDFRVGTLTIAEKWTRWMNVSVSYLSADYLQLKYPLSITVGDVLIINGGICPDATLCAALDGLKVGEKLIENKQFIAAKTDIRALAEACANDFAAYKPVVYRQAYTAIRYPEDIFLQNGAEIIKDFNLLTKGRTSANISSTVKLLGDAIFLEEGASAECCTINTLKGPVYIGRNSEIWEGALIRGPFSLGENSQVKLGTKIYSNVTVGPGCRVGGELNTCLIWGNSSKGHEGYFGSGVMGEWCNWGADTNNSNLKNNYKNVKLYHYGTDAYRNTGLQFCGLIMADHAKCAINTAFNTGTVVGVAASIFGGEVPPTFVPDFSWGVGENAGVYELEKMFETAELVFARRNCKFDPIEASILRKVFEITIKQRNNKI
ncbi:glucose-1-phosphate thymidylyltransferase [Olivibacter sp. SA151]|uniref:putative sugar nucleotidyl transferase n=1 Tax=Olivibacter jilunii TaxID=985016 RepID=UPI003F18043A